LYKVGGRQFIGSWLSSGRTNQFLAYLPYLYSGFDITTTSGLESWYLGRKDWTFDENCPFMKDYTLFIISENRLPPERFLDDVKMKPSKDFDHVHLMDFIAKFSVRVKMFSEYDYPINISAIPGTAAKRGISAHMQVQKALEGMQPRAFVSKIIVENPMVYLMDWTSFIGVVTTLAGKKQDAKYLVEGGYGERVKDPGAADKIDSLTSMVCRNCNATGHPIKDCRKKCTRCIPSCGEIPSLCPRYLAMKREYKGSPRQFGSCVNAVYLEVNAAARETSARGRGGKGKKRKVLALSQISKTSTSISTSISSSTSNASSRLPGSPEMPLPSTSQQLHQPSLRLADKKRKKTRTKTRTKISADNGHLVHSASSQ